VFYEWGEGETHGVNLVGGGELVGELGYAQGHWVGLGLVMYGYLELEEEFQTRVGEEESCIEEEGERLDLGGSREQVRAEEKKSVLGGEAEYGLKGLLEGGAQGLVELSKEVRDEVGEVKEESMAEPETDTCAEKVSDVGGSPQKWVHEVEGGVQDVVVGRRGVHGYQEHAVAHEL
jgi:hypothetical protein